MALLSPERRGRLLTTLEAEGILTLLKAHALEVVDATPLPYVRLEITAGEGGLVAHCTGVCFDVRPLVGPEGEEDYYLPVLGVANGASMPTVRDELLHLNDMLALLERDPSYSERAMKLGINSIEQPCADRGERRLRAIQDLRDGAAGVSPGVLARRDVGRYVPRRTARPVQLRVGGRTRHHADGRTTSLPSSSATTSCFPATRRRSGRRSGGRRTITAARCSGPRPTTGPCRCLRRDIREVLIQHLMRQIAVTRRRSRPEVRAGESMILSNPGCAGASRGACAGRARRWRVEAGEGANHLRAAARVLT